MREQGGEETVSTPLPERDLFQVNKKKHTGHEFKMTKKRVGYDMDGVMLDLGSNMNILPKKSWGVMGKQKLICSSIQLHLENQYNIYPIGGLE
jgi:hypothetical protein